MNSEECKKLADLIFPTIAKGEKPNREQVEAKYPVRDLSAGAEVMRLAPSPTGELHSGSLYLAIINDIISHKNGGKLILRIEDTDKMREVSGAAERMMKYFNHYGVTIDESPIAGGDYGSYIQSERVDSYNAFLYDFLQKGYAYPCFMKNEELDLMREEQTVMKVRPGVYGKYAKSRDLSFEQIKNKIEAGEKYVLRLRSSGDFSKKIKFVDEIMGEMDLSQNDEDFVIAKAEDGIPTYHFAHLIDDHLMRVTFVTRANEWVASITKHMELWDKLGVPPVKYGHIMPINKKDGGSIRKLSKRKDPEASVAYYLREGYTVDALKAYLIRLANPSFDEWWDKQVEESDKNRAKIDINKYEFIFDELKRNSRGPLLDFDKLNNLSSDIVASLNKSEVAEAVLNWSKEYDADLYNIISKDREYLERVLNIERETDKKRKDISKWSMVRDAIGYMYDELYEVEKNKISFNDEQKNILSIIKKELEKEENKKLFDNSISVDEWIGEFKNIYNDNFANIENNNVKFGDMMMLLRKTVTTKEKTPNLYYIFEVIGRDNVLKRL